MEVDEQTKRATNRKQEKLGLLEEDTVDMENEQAPQEPWHARVLRGMVTGVGFLSDAYDLFVINVVILIIGDISDYPPVEHYASGIATSVLVGAVLGQLGFGIVADKVGRRLGFILTLALVITGSIASSLSFKAGPMNVLQCLMIWRFILGVGVGGEYPLSATISAETSSLQNRGKNTALVFSMQGVGSTLATVMGFAFYSALPNRLDIVWRLALAFGAVPGLCMIYFRVRMEETSRFVASKQPDAISITSASSPSLGKYHATAQGPESAIAAEHAGHPPVVQLEAVGPVRRLRIAASSAWQSPKVILIRQNWRRLMGTAGNWFLLDITFYANGLFSTAILREAGVQQDLRSVLIWNIYLTLAALPGYWAAVFLIERVGRKPLQLGGFVLLGIVYLVMGLALKHIEKNSGLFFFMYALTFFVTNMGPNTTTYVLPSESFPTEIRATCHGISAASGKLGAVIGSAMMKPLLNAHGLATVLVVCACVAFLGGIFTFLFTVETLGKSLEQLNTTNKTVPNNT